MLEKFNRYLIDHRLLCTQKNIYIENIAKLDLSL